MHVPDGVLADPIVAGSWAAAVAATAACLRSAEEEAIPKAAVFTACFFVGSTIHVPLGGTSVHLVLNGLCGVVLGPVAFIAIGLGLLLQLLLFSHGGITALGFNACAMGLPAVGAGALFRLWRSRGWGKGGAPLLLGAFLTGGGAVVAASALVAAGLAMSGEKLAVIAPIVVVAHLPIAAVEGFVTALTARFLARVEPKLLGG